MDGDSPLDNEAQLGGISRSGSHHSNDSETPPDSTGLGRTDTAESAASARTKRIACVICRKRKLRCDGIKPSCGTCSRLGHKCAYDEIRRKSGPKRGYVKELEARLAQVETQLKSKNGGVGIRSRATSQARRPGIPLGSMDSEAGLQDHDMMNGFMQATSGPGMASQGVVPNVLITSEPSLPSDSVEFPWEMIGLGLEEPLPPQDMIDELHQIYFDKLQASFPMIHKYRYLAAMNLAPHMRPAICLRYIMWALACSITEKYLSYSDIFYQRSRKYAESDEMKGHGESFITVGHTQCWSLITMYEFKMLYFPRAWMSSGRASRLALMLGLHRQDGFGLEVKQSLPPPRDWTDREERRRTFWVTYCNDRYASIGTGWPMAIDEADIMTNLPASAEAYEKSKAEPTATLFEAINAESSSTLSSFGGVVLMACLFGKNLTHLHRSGASDRPEDPNGEFWKRHHALDNILMTTSMYLPDHLRLPMGNKDANVVFLNMNIHSATICLHQAAILKAEKHDMGANLIRDSTDRCFVAAGEIVSLMKLVSYIDIAHMNPFISFCLYVAARVYTHAYKKRPNDENIRSNLNFLLAAMQAHRKKNNLTESFLVQLIVELDAAGLEYRSDDRSTYKGSKSAEEVFVEAIDCVAIFQKQSQTQPTFHELHQTGSQSPASQQGVKEIRATPPQYQPTFSVPTRERRSSLLSPNSSNSPINGMPLGAVNQGWADKGFVGGSENTNPLYLGRFDAMDAEMSPDGNSEQAVLTPTHSQRASSNTSYSPQNLDDGQICGPIENTVSSTAGAPGPYYAHANQFAGFGATDGFQAHAPATEGTFGVGSEWDMQNTMADSGWAQVLETMGWEDGNGLQQGLPGWRPLPADVGGEKR